MWDTLWTGCRLATMDRSRSEPYGAVVGGALASRGDKIAWIGRESDLPDAPERLAARVIHLDGRWITPGLIDCHTHVVYGGNRAGEFEQRLQGASYEEIARAGGGILSTVRATRDADEESLLLSAGHRLESLLAEGVTTIEIKSGYGLDIATETRMLRVARRLGKQHPVRVVTTFLGAHALPAEYRGQPDAYLDLVCGDMLDAVIDEGLADAVDAFCEGIGFSVEQTERVFQAARSKGLPVKLHAEQLSDLGGARLVAHYGGLSADHLEYLSPEGVGAMAEAGTVAVLLPGAFYVLRETQRPPVEWLRDAGVPIALATDCNPGSSPVVSLLLMLNMGCTLFRVTPEEALAGVTRHAAHALGLGDQLGTLEVGKIADLAIWDIELPAELAYEIGANPLYSVVRAGTQTSH